MQCFLKYTATLSLSKGKAMRSAKFIACCFVEVPYNDAFYNAIFTDKNGNDHVIVGKRGDWLYITDDDCIFTKNQLQKLVIGKQEQEDYQIIPVERLKREQRIKRAQEELNSIKSM